MILPKNLVVENVSISSLLCQVLRLPLGKGRELVYATKSNNCAGGRGSKIDVRISIKKYGYSVQEFIISEYK